MIATFVSGSTCRNGTRKYADGLWHCFNSRVTLNTFTLPFLSLLLIHRCDLRLVAVSAGVNFKGEKEGSLVDMVNF